MKKIILVALSALLITAAAHAKSRQYGAAGCGLGSQLFKNDNGTASQVLAATTNGTFYTQLFGITSGTSNCTDDGLVAARKQVPMFIEANQIALANDIARGNGETLDHLSQVMGCADSAELGSALKANYGDIFTTENIKSSNVTGSILNVVRGDSQLSTKCKYVI